MAGASHARQLVGSLVVAALIVLLTVAVVTIRLGTTSQAELDVREEIAEERQERAEDAADEREERLEDARERRD